MQVAMSLYYNQGVTKKRAKDKETLWHHHSSQGVPHLMGAELGTPVDRRGTSAENTQSGDSLGDSLGPHWDCAWKGNHWRSKYPHLQMEGKMPPPMDWWVPGPPVQAPLLNINVEEPWVVIILEKWKVIFLLYSGAYFSVLPFSPGPWSNNKVTCGISG
jgi:hypothetical protein